MVKLRPKSTSHQEELQRVADQKGITLSVAELVQLDEQRRTLLLAVEELRQQRNTLSQEISVLIRQGKQEEAELHKQQVKTINKELDEREALYRKVDEARSQLNQDGVSLWPLHANDRPFPNHLISHLGQQ